MDYKEKIDYVINNCEFFDDNDGLGLYLTNENIVGTFCGRAFYGKTKEDCAKKCVKYFDKCILCRDNLVKDCLKELSWDIPKKNIDILKNMSKDDAIEFFKDFLCQWASVGDSYIYDLNRVKEAFYIGTMDFEDFVEWDENRVGEVAEEIVDWLFKVRYE